MKKYLLKEYLFRLEKFKDWIYRIFLNPYGVDIQGWCPRQAWGEINLRNHQMYYYFRARGSGWSFDLAKNEQDWWGGKRIFTIGSKNYKIWPECGYLPEWECIKLVNKAIKKYEKVSKRCYVSTRGYC